MGSFPTVPTFQAGQILTAAQLNALAAFTAWMSNPPRVSTYQATVQSIPSSAYTAVSFDTDSFDSDNMHSVTSNKTRVVLNTPGMYQIDATVPFTAANVGNAFMAIGYNGAGVYSNPIPGGAVAAPLSSSLAVMLNISISWSFHLGDYLEVFVYQSSGSSLSLNNTSAYKPAVSVRWVASS